MASEGYAIKLRNQRRKLELAEAALQRFHAGEATKTDWRRYRSLDRCRELVDFERGVVAIMEGY